jgi:predicted N-acyltransferase
MQNQPFELNVDTQIDIRIHPQISEIPSADWNALLSDNNPFIRHEFLHALEVHQCVSTRFGWIPKHIGLYASDKLIAAMPLYEKHNNYGEFVFDQAWSNAWQQVGLEYYPKLVSAAPYTPALGERLLTSRDLDEPQQMQVQGQLIQAIQSLCLDQGLSGAHILFPIKPQQAWLAEQPEWLHRQDCQFHWFNQNYSDFDDFLSRLSAKKRKNIKQERKSVTNAGITFRVLNGLTATEADWQQFAAFYQKTFIEKWSTPTLNVEFFKAVAEALPLQIVLVLADQNNQCIAGSLMFRSDTHLYGRHWGCVQEVKNLHFEACFYQGIEYAIQQGLKVFEPGAGGEHKIARGFIPISMQSAHWLSVNPFPEGITRFISEEKQAVEDYMADCLQHAPYKETDSFYEP